ncbi:unnamed protein product [Nesidiocoris tenuis]|uniref:non-specific serine/threonine protein kinase n=1 Tax=Nesidiocoris tenuis TaxID=355587 RepID=A0A6H5HEY3_9HEMI|nr:unnamed protein product [Nesidiocoris tenuis]
MSETVTGVVVSTGGEIEEGLDACSYFVDGVCYDSQESYEFELKETLRQSRFQLMKEACLSGDIGTVKNIIQELGVDASTVLNLQPNGSNTLLFTACEAGRKDIAKLLLEYGADGRVHQITKHSPLHIAIVKGRKDIVDLLLKKFPELVQQCTVEKWLPIHAAVINGHVGIIDTLLKFQYPQQLYCSYSIEQWTYELPFDVNFKDVTGQTPIYLASLLGNLKMVETMLKFKVKATRTRIEEEKEREDRTVNTRRRISDGIQVLMTRLSLGSKAESNEKLISPWLLDLLCNTEQETALHVAVKNNHSEIASLLLTSGANPNLLSQGDCVCLIEACKLRNITMVDLLLRHNAHDHESKALAVAIHNKDDLLIAKLLSIRAHNDPEYSINKKAMSEAVTKGHAFTSLLANTPVMVNWHGGSAQIPYIRYQWLVGAALHVNPKLKVNPKSQDIVLYAITRLDISNNSLGWIPPVMFQLQSLKQFEIHHHNVWSKNVEVIEHMVTNDDEGNGPQFCPITMLNLSHNQFTSVPQNLPCLAVNLTRLNLSDNRLRSMSHITSYPAQLKQLELSGNQICCWMSLPQIDCLDPLEQAAITCYSPNSATKPKIVAGRNRSFRSAILNSVCTHRRHLRLDNLRTLILADNSLTRIQLTTDDDGITSSEDEHDAEWVGYYLFNLAGYWYIISKNNVPITWDFGGQREYYATHQYFLSKRSLYLVVWKIPDGQKGISEILQWLVNIQARAPNSPVLIVGTHYDMMQENYPLSRAEDLQQLIRDRFINVVDAEKCGLPRVIDTIEVSCKTRHNIRILCNLVYDTVFSLRTPGSKTLLLQQCVPSSYLVLEDVIGQIVAEQKQQKQDPVLTTEQYRNAVASYHTNLRDSAELHQATLFLHENGVLLHYEDSTLKDLYFLDPQWLCDMLAHVVTVREINPFARYDYELTSRNDPEVAIRRLLLLSYVPSGFWSRLITRLLADDTVIQIVREFFIVPKEVTQDMRLTKLLDVRAEWSLWQTGMELRYGQTALFSMKEVIHTNNNSIDYQSLRLQLKQEGIWTDVNFNTVSLLEIHLPLDTLVIKRPVKEQGSDSVIGYQAIVLEPSPQKAAHLLALATDHIDILLEDWYPTLGTRFVHTSEGRLLVTRIVPCPTCLSQAMSQLNNDNSQSKVSPRIASEEGLPSRLDNKPPQYSWMVEECILAAIEKKINRCPVHGEISLAHVAPDTLFLDVGEQFLVNSNTVVRGKLLGRGAFGFVFQGTCTPKTTGTKLSVAIKAIQPVPPPAGASNSAIIAYKNAQVKWERDPIQHASKAYSTARQELGILLTVRHPNIVPLIGLCIDPLCLILGLAPMGALHTILRSYRRCAATLHPNTVQSIVLQVAKALEYLHQQHIIYRDLKSENVLVWSMAAPFQDHTEVTNHIKLADYGISRLTLPTGTKGFGGTEGFMAPEIMKYNGEEEYTEKVDCFSFGMFIYELVTLHQPFESHESVKECILEGGRPNLTQRETHWPSSILDLMVLCWSHQPCDRPTASQIVSVSSAPEFTHMYDVISLNHSSSILTTAAATLHFNPDCSCQSVWLGCDNGMVYQLLASDQNWFQYSCLAPQHTAAQHATKSKPTAICVVRNTVWIGDECARIHAYCINDMKKLWWYSMVEGEDMSPVLRLLWLEPLERIAVVLGCGRIFLVVDSPPSSSSMAEGSFVLTELGSATVLHDITPLLYENNKICELWCGESNGAISVYTLEDSIVANYENLNHYNPVIANVDVVKLVSSDEEHQKYVWTYVYPGCVVYQWDADTKTILHKLDCSKLVPCSESLKSISIDEHLSPGRCQVTSLCVVKKELYIGTTWGCMVVAETWSLRPITVFRPYEGELTAIVALPDSKPTTIATFGRGYRSLIAR